MARIVKRLQVTAIMITVTLLLINAAVAMSKTIIGRYTYTYGDQESLVQAKFTARNFAIENAVESYQQFVNAVTVINKGKLLKDIIQTISAGMVKNIKILKLNIRGHTIFYKISCEIDPKEMRQLIQKRIRKMKAVGAERSNFNNRKSIVVMPFEYQNSYLIFGNHDRGNTISDIFTQAMISKITQSRKFIVLDREDSKYYQLEKDFISSGNLDKKKLSKVGKRLKSDYILIGQILNFSINEITAGNNIGLPETSETIFKVTISYRVLAMATQQIEWSETISKTFNISETINNSSEESAIADASDKIAEDILEHILRQGKSDHIGSNDNGGAKSNVKITPSGGIVLPFD